MESIVNDIEKRFQEETGTKRPLFWQTRVEASFKYIEKYIEWLEMRERTRNFSPMPVGTTHTPINVC